MPNTIYLIGKVWCSHCGEKRDPTEDNFCLECRHKMRTVPRTKKGKDSYKVRLASRVVEVEEW